MPGKYTKSKQADEDIRQLVIRSLEDFGEPQTDKYLSGLEQTLHALADNPYIGTRFKHSRRKTEYLRYRYVSHVVYYRKRKQDIFILRILHSKMLSENHL